MTWKRSYLKELKPYSNSYITFGDGLKGIIEGIGKLLYSGLPSLDNVLLVEGMTANMISISQLYEVSRLASTNHNVSFPSKIKERL